MNWLSRLFKIGLDVPSPSNIVPEGSIAIIEQPKGVLLNLAKLNIPFSKPPTVWIPSIPDTNSMDPGFDFEHNNILIKGADEVDHQRLVNFIKVGDIAVYQVYDGVHSIGYAIHRIVKIGKDSEGRYFAFQGDNAPIRDPWRIRDNMIKWLCIGTIF